MNRTWIAIALLGALAAGLAVADGLEGLSAMDRMLAGPERMEIAAVDPNALAEELRAYGEETGTNVAPALAILPMRGGAAAVADVGAMRDAAAAPGGFWANLFGPIREHPYISTGTLAGTAALVYGIRADWFSGSGGGPVTINIYGDHNTIGNGNTSTRTETTTTTGE
jgi:hypothetical protein